MSSSAASSLPKVSYVKAIDIWLMLCLTYDMVEKFPKIKNIFFVRFKYSSII